MIDLFTNFRFNLSQVELDANVAGRVSDFINYIDTATSHEVGVFYDCANERITIYSDVDGGNPVHIPGEVIAGAWYYVSVSLRNAGAGLIEVNVHQNSVDYGSFTTSTAINIDTIKFGSIVNQALCDRFIDDLRVGTSPGQSDVFSVGSFSAGTIVPPFDSTTGTGLSIPTGQGYLHVDNDGSADAYGEVSIGSPTFPEIEIEIPANSLHFIGADNWRVSGNARYRCTGWELDQLIIPFRGPLETKEAFLTSLVMWGRCELDENMFLADWNENDDKRFPQVELIFIGKKGSVLPPDKHSQTKSVQQTSAKSGIGEGVETIQVTYESYASQLITYSREPITFADVTPIAPANVTLLWITSDTEIIWPGTWEELLPVLQSVVALFMIQRTVETGGIEELVPGQYYRATKVTQTMLFAIV